MISIFIALMKLKTIFLIVPNIRERIALLRKKCLKEFGPWPGSSVGRLQVGSLGKSSNRRAFFCGNAGRRVASKWGHEAGVLHNQQFNSE